MTLVCAARWQITSVQMVSSPSCCMAQSTPSECVWLSAKKNSWRQSRAGRGCSLERAWRCFEWTGHPCPWVPSNSGLVEDQSIMTKGAILWRPSSAGIWKVYLTPSSSKLTFHPGPGWTFGWGPVGEGVCPSSSSSLAIRAAVISTSHWTSTFTICSKGGVRSYGSTWRNCGGNDGMEGTGSVGVMGSQLGPRVWIGGAGITTWRVWRCSRTSGWMWWCGGGMGIAGVSSMDSTSQSSISKGGYSSSGSGDAGIAGMGRFRMAGIAMDGVAEKLTIMFEIGLWNMLAQWLIMAACVNVHKYTAPSSFISSSIRSSWYALASSMAL